MHYLAISHLSCVAWCVYEHITEYWQLDMEAEEDEEEEEDEDEEEEDEEEEDVEGNLDCWKMS